MKGSPGRKSNPQQRRAAREASVGIRRSRPGVESLESRTLYAAQLSPVADADTERRISDVSFANANFGADPSLRVAKLDDSYYESFVRFDISSVTSVGTAVVQMNGGLADPQSGGSFISIFQTPETDWVEGNGIHPVDGSNVGLNMDNNPEGEITWNTRPGGNTGGDLDTVEITASGVHFWDVTNYLQARKAAGATSVSFVFRNTSGAGLAIFNSRDALVDAPQLIIQDDVTTPTASASSPTVTSAGGVSQSISVTYADDAGINPMTIGLTDLTVTGSGGALSVTAVNVNATNSKAVVATYTVTPPGGSWSPDDNGSYSITVNGGEVLDYGGNAATGGGSFSVAIPVDVTPPVVARIITQPISSAGGANYTFTVNYTDDVSLDAASIDTSDVVVTPPGGGSPLAIQSVTKSGSGTAISATYTLAAPGGTWTAADNGVYSISVRSGAVADGTGNVSAAASGSFTVAVPDTGSPTTSIAPIGDVTTAGLTSTQITVTYTDNQAIRASTIDASDLSVVQDGGAGLAVSLLSRSTNSDTGSIVAIYSVAAPGGFWNADDNGTYTVTLLPGVVTDTSGNGTGLAAASYEVAIQSTTAVTDPQFNGGRAISTGFVAEALATDATGRILVAGRQGTRSAGTSQSVLQRLNADGTLDTFFGAGGQIISLPQTNDGFLAVALDEKQRLLVGGYIGGKVQVARFTAKDRLDRKFGAGGVLIADWDPDRLDTITAILPQAGGGLVVAGTSGNDFAFARYDDRGRPDAGFGTGGVSVFPASGGTADIGVLAALPAGGFAAAGTQGSSVVLLMLSDTGSLVPGFGAGGIKSIGQLGTRTDVGGADRTIGLAVTREGGFYVGSRTPGGDFGLVKLNPDGTPDTRFDNDGLATVDFGGDDDVDFVGLQGTGQIVLGGTTTAGASAGTRKLAVAVLKPDGTLAPTFSAGGKFTDDAGIVGSGGPYALHANGVMQSNGRALLTLADADTKPTSSPLRRLITPGAGVAGSFGSVSGKNAKLTLTDPDGSRVNISLKGGTGQALFDGDQLDLILTGTGDRSTIKVNVRGGNGRASIRDVQTDGSLARFNARKADLVGTLAVNGNVTKLVLGNVSGTIAASGVIGSVTVAGAVSGAFLLSGVNLGGDAKIGGSDEAADTYAGGDLGKLVVTGRLAASFIGVGVNPTDGVFGNANDVAATLVPAAFHKMLVRGGIDGASRFEAGVFGVMRAPRTLLPDQDERFSVLS